MKKTLTTLIALALLVGGISNANALSTDKEYSHLPATTKEMTCATVETAQDAKVEAAKEYAYRDLSKASPEEKEIILAARNTIIFSQGWAADGYELYVKRANGSVEKRPQFSELFPDWDMPVFDITTGGEQNDTMSSVNNMRNSSVPCLVYIRNPGNTDTPSFYSFYHTGTYVETYVTSLSSSETCNIGYSNEATGASLGWDANLYPGDSCILLSLYLSPLTVGVRASTYSLPGYGVLTVTYDSSGLVK